MLKNRSDQKTNDLTESLLRLAYLAEINEWDNRRHLERIRNYSYLLASEYGLSRDESQVLSLACTLHDVGKAMTPVALIKRPGNFQPDEWAVIEKHTTQGAEILNSLSSFILQTAATVALTHHERWDGSGYPNRMKKDDIPLSGRICAIADVFDALTTKRPYKKLISDEEALRLIKDNSNILFDPDLVKAFEKQFQEIKKIKSTFE